MMNFCFVLKKHWSKRFCFKKRQKCNGSTHQWFPCRFECFTVWARL